MAFDPIGPLEDYLNKRKKSPSQIHDCSIPGSQCASNVKLSGDCSVRKENLLPLCFEDELKKPNAKIINVNAPKTEVSHMEQNDTTPIIFHDTRYVQMILLTKNKIPLPHSNKESIYPFGRANFVLERNRGVYKSLIGGQSSTPSNVKETVPAAWREKKPTTPLEVKCRWVEEKRKRKTHKQILENKYWNKHCNFSQTLASLTKNAESFLNKTIGQEMNAKTGKLERMFSTRKPMSTHKFCASAVKLSKPLKNKLEIHKVSHVTPLDDLLVMTSKA
ncbi:uncharacterized protein C1orf141 homolog [Echinops telfairi]|uniref:Uncharacterized protein C1orf141 homolog n=1 Tax=Echinops telfairi TaxID=9371 RepID=A0ABM0ZPM7_ECHTE|nr:uncharacterized protein C1orf141 homolog [Echinops telfairi]